MIPTTMPPQLESRSRTPGRRNHSYPLGLYEQYLEVPNAGSIDEHAQGGVRTIGLLTEDGDQYKQHAP